MAYSHSFTDSFYGDPYNCSKDKQPSTVCDALASMPVRQWNKMCREVFGCKPDFVDIDTVLLKIIETDTVSNLDIPVTVWIDSEGFWMIDVYDSY